MAKEKVATTGTTSPAQPQVQFSHLPLTDIVADPHQPRHYFSQVDDDELMESVREHGVIQPILVRPHNGKYMIVCGERRYRASLAVATAYKQRNTIPATIRQLSDTETLELQIIENLQRKDVQPMDEAVAFNSLTDRFSIEEIALRVGKSAVYVAQRINLTNLVPDFQEMLFQQKMQLGQAYKLCRLNKQSQLSIFKEAIWKNDWKTDPEYQLRDIDHYLSRQLLDLDKGIFKTEDETLYPEAGTCNKCPQNTANSPLLFPDLNAKRLCNNAVCFNIKTERQKKRNLEALLADTGKLVIAGSSYLSSDDKQTVKAAQDIGLSIVDPKLFERNYNEPDDPAITFEQWMEDQAYDMDDEDIEEMRADYQAYVKENEADLRQQKEAIANGTLRMAYSLTDAKEVPIKLIGEAITPAANDGSDTTKMEIAKIKEREKRNLELDEEKVDAAVQQIFQKSEAYTNPKRDSNLTQNEIIAVALVLFKEGSYTYRDWLNNKFKLNERYSLRPQHLKAFENLTQFGINEMLRHFIKEKLEHQAASRNTNAIAAATFALAKENEPEAVQQAIDDQQAITNTRADRVAKRISALKNSTPKNNQPNNQQSQQSHPSQKSPANLTPENALEHE